MTDCKDCMTNALVVLAGCEDTTRFHLECTEEEYDFLQRVSAMSNEASTYGCMPVMQVIKTRPCKYSKLGWCDTPEQICSLCWKVFQT